MKMLLAFLLACGCTLVAQAGELVVRKVKPTTVTGTNIAQPVKRIGNTYDTPQAIYVIDRAHIEQSGASSLGQLLRSYPGIGIR